MRSQWTENGSGGLRSDDGWLTLGDFVRAAVMVATLLALFAIGQAIDDAAEVEDARRVAEARHERLPVDGDEADEASYAAAVLASASAVRGER